MLVLNFEVGHFACHFLFLSFSVAMKGIQFTQLRSHISFLSFIHLTTCFLSSCRWLLDSYKCWLFCLHIQHTTHCLFEQQTLFGSSEAAVCRFCLSISLQLVLSMWPKQFQLWEVPNVVGGIMVIGGIIIFTQPLRSGRKWHKVNFLSGV